jgi:hypothetical protein
VTPSVATTLLGYVGALAMFAAMQACGQPLECLPDATTSCACANGQTGFMVCNAAGKVAYQSCPCIGYDAGVANTDDASVSMLDAATDSTRNMVHDQATDAFVDAEVTDVSTTTDAQRSETCDRCGSDQTCDHGTCVSNCSCAGRTCGPNNCGNSCGTCLAPATCLPTGYCSNPTVHTVALRVSPPLFYSYSFSFSMPTQAFVAYDALSTDGDTFNVGIFTPDDWAVYANGGSGARVWAPHYKTSTVTDGANLPAGNYVLGFACTNLIERCAVRFSISAAY